MWATIAVSTLLAGLLLGGASLAGRVRFGPFAGAWRVPPLRLRPQAAARFGQVRSNRLPLAFTIDAGGDEALAGAGRMAARAFFRDRERGPGAPAFEVRAVAATARPGGAARHGAWAEPRSPWHAALFGALEVLVPAAGGRPFARGTDGKLLPADLARLIAAAHTYAASYVYGVPLGALAACEHLDATELGIAEVPPETWAGATWDTVEVRRLPVVSPARASGDPRALVTVDGIASRAWRFTLGTAPPRETLARSFGLTALRLRVRTKSRREREPEGGEQLVTTVLVASVAADAPEEVADALLAAEEQALADWWEALVRAGSHRD